MKTSLSQLEAAGFAVAAFSLWVLADTSIKIAGRSRLPVWEVLAFQGLTVAALMLARSLLRGEPRALLPQRPKRQIFRALLELGNNIGVVFALRHLPLTLFYILVFTQPMVTSVEGVLFLRERLSRRKIVAILLGFLGVVVAVDPFRLRAAGDWRGYAACAFCVACFSTNILLSRRMTQTERPESLTFVSGTVTGLVGLAGTLWHGQPVSGRLTGLLLALGLFSALGSLCFFTAIRHAPVATVAQYHYTQLITGAAITYVLWRERPTVSMLMGAVLIVAAGLAMALASRNDGTGPPNQRDPALASEPASLQ